MHVAFLNSGILGHRSVQRVFQDAVGALTNLRAAFISCGDPLDLSERVIRKAVCAQPFGRDSALAAMTAFRWRAELNSGLTAKRRLKKYERENGPVDAIHFHTQATAYTSLARMATTPSIVSIDASQRLAYQGPQSRSRDAGYKLSLWHDSRVFKAAARIVSTSDWAAKDVAELCPEVADKLLVLPYPIEVSAFDSVIDKRRRNENSDRPRALFIGGDFYRKGGYDLLEAWRDSQLGLIADLDLVTDWPIEERLLSEGVHVHKRVASYSDRWFELWGSADLFVMPTKDEAFGMVYQEAAAAGIPSIGTRINAIPEIIDDGETGILITPGDKNELAQALRNLITSQQRFDMGAASRARALLRFDPKEYAATIEDVLNTAVEKKCA